MSNLKEYHVTIHKVDQIMAGRKKGTTKNVYLKPKHIYVYNLENRR